MTCMNQGRELFHLLWSVEDILHSQVCAAADKHWTLYYKKQKQKQTHIEVSACMHTHIYVGETHHFSESAWAHHTPVDTKHKNNGLGFWAFQVETFDMKGHGNVSVFQRFPLQEVPPETEGEVSSLLFTLWGKSFREWMVKISHFIFPPLQFWCMDISEKLCGGTKARNKSKHLYGNNNAELRAGREAIALWATRVASVLRAEVGITDLFQNRSRRTSLVWF